MLETINDNADLVIDTVKNVFGSTGAIAATVGASILAGAILGWIDGGVVFTVVALCGGVAGIGTLSKK